MRPTGGGRRRAARHSGRPTAWQRNASRVSREKGGALCLLFSWTAYRMRFVCPVRFLPPEAVGARTIACRPPMAASLRLSLDAIAPCTFNTIGETTVPSDSPESTNSNSATKRILDAGAPADGCHPENRGRIAKFTSIYTVNS